MKKQNELINLLKTFFIVFIVAYHFFLRHNPNYEVNSFIPNAVIAWGGFFILSGLFFRIENGKKFLLKKIVSLFIPLLVSLFVILLFILIFDRPNTPNFIDIIMNFLCLPMISGMFAYLDGAHWYIVLLLYVTLVLYVIRVCIAKTKQKRLEYLIILSFSFFCFLSFFLPTSNDFFLALKCIFDARLTYFFLGYFLALFISNRTKFNFILSLISLIQTLIYTVMYCFWINVLYMCAIIALILLAYLFGNTKKIKGLLLFSMIGKYSLFTYLIHQRIGYILIDLLYDSGVNYYVASFGILITMIIIGTSLSYLYNKFIIKSFVKKCI